ncbi:MAG: division/cell wall cluster transcriptional repressor MraZ [Nitrospirota bacterium]|jgi:MraZ protein
MRAFSGKYYYSLDPKGRLMIPAPFRDIIAGRASPNLYITNAPSEHCLHIYPEEEWFALAERVRVLPRMDRNVRLYMRRVIASAVSLTLDKQGRVLVPAAHREDSGLNAEVVIVGQIDKIEVWDRTMWDQVNDLSRIDLEAYEAALSNFGL